MHWRLTTGVWWLCFCFCSIPYNIFGVGCSVYHRHVIREAGGRLFFIICFQHDQKKSVTVSQTGFLRSGLSEKEHRHIERLWTVFYLFLVGLARQRRGLVESTFLATWVCFSRNTFGALAGERVAVVGFKLHGQIFLGVGLAKTLWFLLSRNLTQQGGNIRNQAPVVGGVGSLSFFLLLFSCIMS